MQIKMEKDLLHIETANGNTESLSSTAQALATLQESARLETIHYSTMMAGNKLTLAQVQEIIINQKINGHFHEKQNTFSARTAAQLRTLDQKQRQILELFVHHDTITARQVGQLLHLKPRTSAHLCQTWTKNGFLTIANPSNKARAYRLAPRYTKLAGSNH